MAPFLLPAPYNNGNMHFVQNSAMYPSAYLQRELTPRNYAGDYRHNEPSLETNVGEYHLNQLAMTRFVEEYHLPVHATQNYNYVGEYHLVDPAVKNYVGEYHLNEPAATSYFGEYHHHNELKGKEDYLDEVLQNAHKIRRARMKNASAVAASNSTQGSYLRSLKRKKLKSFMVRDLIDLPADENRPDVCDDNNNQYQNMLPDTGLTTPLPEAVITWEKYEPYSTSVGNKPELYSPDALGTFVSCLMNEPEPSYLDTTRSSDTYENRSGPLYPDSTRTGYTFISNEPASRISSPGSECPNSDLSSGEGAASPCGKSKRVRTIFSCSQLERLEDEFQRTHYMVGSERSQLASQLNLNESQVKIWFQNRRIKHRKQFHEQQQAMLSKLKESQRDSQAELEKDANKENSLSSTCSEESSS